MRAVLLPVLAMLLPLAACGRSEEPRNYADASDNAAVQEPDSPIEGEPPASPSPPPKPPSATVTDQSRLPAAFLGEWTGVNADCADKAADMHLAITPRALQFYESQGTIVGVAQASPRAVRIDASYEGEGQSWTRKQTLTLSDGGDRLTITDEDSSVARKRCS